MPSPTLPDGPSLPMGFYVDITEAFHADLQQEVGDELQVIVGASGQSLSRRKAC